MLILYFETEAKLYIWKTEGLFRVLSDLNVKYNNGLLVIKKNNDFSCFCSRNLDFSESTSDLLKQPLIKIQGTP